MTRKNAKYGAQLVNGVDMADMPLLPESIQADPELARQGAQWLDAYIEFSKICAPRSYEWYHEMCGLWILSTICARRVCLVRGQFNTYPSLYLVLCGDSSVYTKSSATKIALNVIRAMNLKFFMLPNEMTPPVLVSNLANKPIKTDSKAEAERRAKAVAFAGQKSWLYDEFGQKMSQMMRPNSYMGDFHGLLREMADCPEEYEYETRTHGKEKVTIPYLSLLAAMTPADAEPYAHRNSPLWRDGFWARIAFTVPPLDTPHLRLRLPRGYIPIPTQVLEPLQQWHVRLGEPTVEITEEDQPDKKVYVVEKLRHPLEVLDLTDDVDDASYAYADALLDAVTRSGNSDLTSSYARLAEHALRAAILFASIDDSYRVELRHWHRAQQIAEHWRASLHTLYYRCTAEVTTTRESTHQDAILRYLMKKGGRSTLRDVSHDIKGLDAAAAKKALEGMKEARMIELALKYNRNGTTTTEIRFVENIGDEEVDGTGTNESDEGGATI